MGLWSLLRSVNQQSLKSCRLDLDDRPFKGASLFPLFDDEGRTQMVMIATEESGRIMLADWRPGLFERDWALRNRVRLQSTDLSDASMWDEERFADLWHFDPWWVLREERYHGHGAVPALQGTNIPGYDSTWSGAVFDPTLERVSYVVKKSAHSESVLRFKTDTLSAIAQRRRSALSPSRRQVAAGWRLRPFWQSL